MSSVSSFEPDNSDDSDFSIESNRGRQQRRSTSRLESLDLRFPHSEERNLSQDHASYETEPEGGTEDEPKSSQNRWEQRDALLADLKQNSLAQYVTLLKQTESDIPATKLIEDDNTYTITQNGSVVWTSAEKTLLFRLLDKNGKAGIQQIASMLGSKSELEVVDYLELIHRGLERLKEKRSPDTIVLGDVPAAVEVSKECCAELDKYARALVMREDLDLELAHRATYDANALIAHDQAWKLVAEEVNPPLRGRIDLAANVLHVPGWVNLSTMFFMNFGGSRSEDCWSNIVQSKSESPSLHGEALMDFYALTMSITRRLVQSAIFFAMTRLHGLRAMGRERGKFVRTRDVRAALDVLNMKHGRAGFFVDVARRNCLAITDKVDGEEQPRVISYDKAHEILQTEENSESESESDQDDISSELERDDGQSESDSVLSEFTSDSSSLPRTESYEIPLDPEEEDANLLDLEISRREETKLWRLLEQPVPSRLRVQLIPENKNEKDILVHRPPRECTSPEDYNPTDRDWRDRTLYCSDWEVYADGTQELEDDLNENRRKRCWTMYEEKTSEEVESPRKKTAPDVITIDDSAKEDAGVGTVVDESLDEMSEDRMDVDERSHIPSVVKPRYGSAE
ncbi:uncharacterized protein N7484_003721 [Penicillium longicatenatum]|uniref:uncharacterized protein n=1 Tax=Penicillium longicatenatum TaxID=1561947 RepID=UPI00254705F7|nr:uncharacterized protein N7484_003721 [Penicillium longicatenatum]KAJ5649998.1 hypothetical protein N7484_003721 [Penicillium longicatenatum]